MYYNVAPNKDANFDVVVDARDEDEALRIVDVRLGWKEAVIVPRVQPKPKNNTMLLHLGDE